MIQQYADNIRRMGRDRGDYEVFDLVALAVESLEDFKEYNGNFGVKTLQTVSERINKFAEGYK